MISLLRPTAWKRLQVAKLIMQVDHVTHAIQPVTEQIKSPLPTKMYVSLFTLLLIQDALNSREIIRTAAWNAKLTAVLYQPSVKFQIPIARNIMQWRPDALNVKAIIFLTISINV